MLSRRDTISAIATGLVTAFSAWRVLAFLGKPILFGIHLYWLLIIIPLAWIAGVELGYLLGRWFAPFARFGKFAAIGFANAGVDFGVLYLLIALTGRATGIAFSLFKTTSFIFAVTHSYFWNKYWAFDAGNSNGGSREFFSFIGVTLISLLFNVSIASFVVNFIHPVLGLSVNAWAGAGAVAGAAFSLIFSFVGFKMIVFRK